MRHALRHVLLGMVLLLGMVPFGRAQVPVSAASKIARIEIRHVGPQEVNDDLIRARIRVKVGDVYNPASVDDDVRNLYATGLFDNIQVTEEHSADGYVLTYVVQGKLKLTDIKFSGNHQLSTSKLRKKVTSKVGEPLDQLKLFSDSQALVELYQKAGYPNTGVKAVVTPDENAGRAAVTFEITESPKVRILDVQFVGATAFSQKQLRKVIKTRRHWMFSWITGSGVLKKDQLEDDEDKLAQFYRDHGYIDYELKDVKMEYPQPNRMVLRFYIYEGKPYKIGAVTFHGNTLFTTNDIARGLRSLESTQERKEHLGPHGLAMDVGDVFTPQGLSRDVEQIEDFYGAQGHIDVTEGPNLTVEKIPNTENNTMDLRFDINEGQKSYIYKIEIRGNTKTKDKVIRRELAVAPGEPFDMVKVKLSKSRLEQMQYFSKVDTKQEPVDIPNRKNLVVGVEEKSTGNLTVGAGFNSVSSLVGFVDITQGNFDLFHPPRFTGGGQKARLHFAIGTQQRDVRLSFVEPWFLGRRLEFDLDLYSQELDYLSLNSLYNESRTGARVGLRKDLWRNRLIGGVSYTLESVGILDTEQLNSRTILATDPATGRTYPVVVPVSTPSILDAGGHNLLSRFGATLAYDTRNSALLPNRGQRTELVTELVGGGIGGDRNFYKAELHTDWFFPGFATGHILELVGRVGVADALGGSKDVPFYDRYYLGGMYSLRGYDYRDIGPKEAIYGSPTFLHRGVPTFLPVWEPVGGNTYWFGSLEYSIPLIERVRLAAFYDVGMVYRRPFSFSGTGTAGGLYDPGSYSDNWGLGVRLNLPMIGPLRLDYGIPIHHDPMTSGSGHFQFGIGYTREF